MSKNSLGSKQPLALPQVKPPPLCVCVLQINLRITVVVPQVSDMSELKDPNGLLLEEGSNDWQQ